MWWLLNKVVEEVRQRAGVAANKAVAETVAERILRQLDKERGSRTVASYVRNVLGKKGKCHVLFTRRQNLCATNSL
jgi:hypothetical protein